MPDDELKGVASARLGQVLRGKYRLDRVLGIGGMATVYAATHRNKKRFAIKMLHPELSVRENIRTRFLREGYVANSVDHSGAVAVLDDDVAEDGSAFLVMELLDGSALDVLASKHEGHKLPVGLVLSTGDALLDVLAAAHAKGIVHRDLKPANVFLTNDGRLEVLDFGIARLHDETSHAQHATQTGAMLGTPAFMAPEQALAEQSKIDAQTDLWAVGATLFTLLSGALVHEGENASQLMVRAATSKARSLATVAPEVPKAVADVVDRALAFEKKDRWESARAMREALAKSCIEATGAPIAPLPRTEPVTGLEATVALDAQIAAGATGVGFDATVDGGGGAGGAGAPGAKPALTTAGGASAPEDREGTNLQRGRRRAAWIAVALTVAATSTAGVFAWTRVRQSAAARTQTSPSATASAAPQPGRTPATPQAAAAWEAALQAEHDGNSEAALRNLRAAVASDPSLGAAYLRLAIAQLPVDSAEAHEEYQKALEHRAALGDVDSELLGAWEPAFREPLDLAERLKRIQVVADRYPRDPYLQTRLAWALNAVGRDATGAFEQALADDPTYVPAYETWIGFASASGDSDTLTKLTARCLQAAPAAVACLAARADIENFSGNCAAMKADARSLLALDPKSHHAYRMLAGALLALGESLDAVIEAAHRGDATIADPVARRAEELGSQEWLAIARGDFVTAAKTDADRASLLESSQRDPLPVLMSQLLVEREAGDLAAARSVVARARLILKAGSAYRVPFFQSMVARASAHLGSTTRAQSRAELEGLWAQEEAKIGRKLAEGAFDNWMEIDAFSAIDEVDAQDALDVLAERKIDVSSHLRSEWSAAVVGRLYALVGRFADAAPLLEKIARSCGGDDDLGWTSMLLTQNRYLGGLSREKNGDIPGSKAAYERVLARWGSAKPRSVTADKARAGLARLAQASPSTSAR